MTWYVVAGIANVATSGVLLLLASLKRGKTFGDFIFIVFCGAIFQFTVFHLFWQLANNPTSGSFFGRYLMLGPIFIPVLFFHYILVVNGGKEIDPILVKMGYVLGFLFMMFLPTRYFISRVEPQRWFPYWTIPGPLLHLHVASYIVFISRSVFLLRHRLKSLVGLGKEQSRYMFAGALLGFGGGGMNYLSFYDLPIKPYGHVLVFIGEAIVGYAVLRYRLTDLNSILRRTLGYLFFSAILAFPSALILSTLNLHRGLIFLSVLVLVGFVGPCLYLTLQASLLGAIDHLPPFRERYSRFRDIGRIIGEFETVKDVDAWAEKTVDSVRHLYSVRGANVLIRDEKQEGFLIRSGYGLNRGEQELLFLPLTSLVLKKLGEKRMMLVSDLADEVFESREIREAKSDLAFVHGAVSVPLFSGGILFALLNVDQKQSGEMFNDLELANLRNIANAAEHQLTVILSGVNREQRSLEWAHDLARPFGEKGSLGEIEALAKGKCGPLGTEANTVLERVADEMRFVGKHLRRFVKGKDHPLSIAPQKMAEMCQRVVKRFESQATDGKINLRATAPGLDVPILCDGGMIEYRVYGNLIENALRHTPPGGTVEVGYRLEENKFMGYVRDTGPGIKKEDIPPPVYAGNPTGRTTERPRGNRALQA
jgi:signal transduction histidine kinase